jgi:AcrR family transcriptional regulator
VSLRERKKQASRRAIHQAAFDLVSERGLSQVTIEAISERAGVAPRTFWAYFSSKEEAVVDRDPLRPTTLAAALLQRPAAEDPLTALRHVLEQDLSTRSPEAEVARRRFELIRSDPHLMAAVAAWFDEIERSLVDALAIRLGRDTEADLFPGVMVAAAFGAFRVAHRRWGDPADPRSIGELLAEAFARLNEGMTEARTEGRAGGDLR